MRNRVSPLLAELHVHTTWSDGELSVPELVDLYGSRGFHVLCITDHVVRRDDPWLDAAEWRDRGVRSAVYAGYRVEIERESRRARRPATSTASSTSTAGRRSSRARRRPAPWSPTLGSRRRTYLAQIGDQALPAAA